MKQLPNALTILRLVLVPLIWKLLWDRDYEWALAAGFIAAVSDALDGFFARRLNATSKFGEYLDPVADKLMMSGAFLIFGMDRVTPAWLPWIVIGRDVLILLFAVWAYFFTSIREFPPSRWGKLSTLIQILTAFVILFNRSILMDLITYQLERWMIWACAAITIGSGLHYCWLASQALRRTSKR